MIERCYSHVERACLFVSMTQWFTGSIEGDKSGKRDRRRIVASVKVRLCEFGKGGARCTKVGRRVGAYLCTYSLLSAIFLPKALLQCLCTRVGL